MFAVEVPHSPREKRKASSGVEPNRKALKSLLLPLSPLTVNSILRSPKNSWLATAKDWPEEKASRRPRATFHDSEGAQEPFTRSKERNLREESDLLKVSSWTNPQGA